MEMFGIPSRYSTWLTDMLILHHSPIFTFKCVSYYSHKSKCLLSRRPHEAIDDPMSINFNKVSMVLRNGGG